MIKLEDIAKDIIKKGNIPVSFYITLTGQDAELAASFEEVTNDHPLFIKLEEALLQNNVPIEKYSFGIHSALNHGTITYFAFYNDWGK